MPEKSRQLPETPKINLSSYIGIDGSVAVLFVPEVPINPAPSEADQSLLNTVAEEPDQL